MCLVMPVYKDNYDMFLVMPVYKGNYDYGFGYACL